MWYIVGGIVGGILFLWFLYWLCTSTDVWAYENQLYEGIFKAQLMDQSDVIKGLMDENERLKRANLRLEHEKAELLGFYYINRPPTKSKYQGN
jgi:hypothetical protein